MKTGKKWTLEFTMDVSKEKSAQLWALLTGQTVEEATDELEWNSERRRLETMTGESWRLV